MLILGIDTSCDDTSAAVVYKDNVLSNIISSQVHVHKDWGGVVPSLAKRKHEELIDHIIELALTRSRKKITDVEAIAITIGPGLAIALEVGIKKAKELALLYNKPIIPINHMEGHVYSALAKNSKGKPDIEYQLPMLAVLVSGGHTEIVLMRNHGEYEILGQTLDDAIGESFDKVGRILNMGYPAGPVLEKIAESGDENTYSLPIPMQHSKDLNLSYSGLKTATMRIINEEIGALNRFGMKFSESLKSLSYSDKNCNNQESEKKNISHIIANISASFQKASIEQLIIKVSRSLDMLRGQGIDIQDMIIAGGVAQNKYLRKKFRRVFSHLRIHYPTSKKLFTDNAAMIAVAGYFNYLNNKILTKLDEINKIDRLPNWKLNEI
jgi:N6-L-threonylcarbamoyladenine synthase